jgi:hypothetical protein
MKVDALVHAANHRHHRKIYRRIFSRSAVPVKKIRLDLKTMSKHQLAFFILFLISVLFSGCMPIMPYTIYPGASGTVVDVKDNSPIKGASVHYEASTYSSSTKRQISTTTNDRGEFSIPAVQEWGRYAGPEAPMVQGSVRIQASGYKETTRGFSTLMTGPAHSKLGVILLDRSQ